MAYKYTVREKAVEDIEEIIAYIADDNPKAALKLYQTFLKHFIKSLSSQRWVASEPSSHQPFAL